MLEILDFIKLYSQKQTELDKKFIEELYYFLRSQYLVEDYVENINISTRENGHYFAYYIPSSKSLSVFQNKIMKDIITFINTLNLPSKDRKMAIYLCFFHIVNHEFKHIIQEKKKHTNPKSIESRTLYLANRAERQYLEDGMLFARYKIDPIERQAELSSLGEFITMTQKENIKVLEDEMTKRYVSDAIKGYFPPDFREYPAGDFFICCSDYDYEMKRLVNELNDYPVKNDNFKERIELGLRITDSEYKKLEKVIKR